MAVFVLVPTSRAEEIGVVIAARHLEGSYKLPRGEWLISYQGTSQQLSDYLGITDASTGNAVIFSVGGYYGNAPTAIWEWIQANWK